MCHHREHAEHLEAQRFEDRSGARRRPTRSLARAQTELFRGGGNLRSRVEVWQLHGSSGHKNGADAERHALYLACFLHYPW